MNRVGPGCSDTPIGQGPPSNRTSGSPTSGSPRALPSRVRHARRAELPQADQAVVVPRTWSRILLVRLVAPTSRDMGPHSAQDPLVEMPEETPRMRLSVV